MVEAPLHRRDIDRHGGFTLIEVVVALAIFVFGAVAIIRIFPPALGVIQNSGDRLTAINFNRANLTRFDRQPDLVPDIILDNPGSATYSNWRDNQTGSVAGSPRRNNSMPSSSVNNIDDEFNFTALGHFKTIIGEKQKVKTDGVVFVQHRYLGTPTIYLEETLSGVTVDSITGILDFSNATNDSNNSSYSGGASNPPATDTIYVSYNWIDNSSGQNRIWAVDEELFGPPPVPLVPPLPVNPPPYKVTRPLPITGEVKVRVRRPLTLTQAPASMLPLNQLGLLDFKDTSVMPQTVPPTLRLPAGTAISVDYNVEDWRWLTYDGVPSIIRQDDTSKYRTVKLPIQVLDRNLPKYALTYFPSFDPNKSMRDNETSEKVTGTNSSLFEVDSKSSQITFDTTTANDPAAPNPNTPPVTIPNARIIYRTSDNWTNQISVAARSYFLNYPPSTYAEPWRSCAFDANSGKNVIYFQPSEAGKSVVVSYSYTDPITGDQVVINGRIITISNVIIPDAGLSLPAGIAVGNRVSRLELTSLNSQSLGAASITSVREVKGASIQSRMAWLDGNNFTQVSSTGFRGGSN